MYLTATNQSVNDIIIIMYGGLIIYFIYRQIKSIFEKRKITGSDRHYFRKNISKVMIALSSLIILFGIFNIVNKQYTNGGLMIAVVLILWVDIFDKIIITEDGIYGQGNYITWDKVKKWGFDVESNEFVALYKDGMSEKNIYIKVEKEHIDEMNELIRHFKLKK